MKLKSHVLLPELAESSTINLRVMFLKALLSAGEWAQRNKHVDCEIVILVRISSRWRLIGQQLVGVGVDCSSKATRLEVGLNMDLSVGHHDLSPFGCERLSNTQCARHRHRKPRTPPKKGPSFAIGMGYVMLARFCMRQKVLAP